MEEERNEERKKWDSLLDKLKTEQNWAANNKKFLKIYFFLLCAISCTILWIMNEWNDD